LLLWVEECREVHSTIRHEEERMDGGKDGGKEVGSERTKFKVEKKVEGRRRE
jgi:hypothetical protein